MFSMGAATTSTAQEFAANNIYPDAPVPEVLHVHAIMKAPFRTPLTFKHRWLTLNSMSIATLVAGAAIDSWGTYKNMTHTKWICGNSPAFGGGYDTNVPDQISSLRDIQTVCGAGLAGQSANWAFDATQVGYFSEGGWVTQFHLTGDRNYAGVEGWNLANDVGWYLVARHLGRRTDWIAKCGPALNFGRGLCTWIWESVTLSQSAITRIRTRWICICRRTQATRSHAGGERVEAARVFTVRSAGPSKLVQK
jgi:hypothetical protein